MIVLAVDDDRLVLTNTAAMLEDLGHGVVEAIGGKQALEILSREDAFDLVITDQAMPLMTRAQLGEATKTDWPAGILATGYAELPRGVARDLHLSKPFGQRNLSRALASVLPVLSR